MRHIRVCKRCGKNLSRYAIKRVCDKCRAGEGRMYEITKPDERQRPDIPTGM